MSTQTRLEQWRHLVDDQMAPPPHLGYCPGSVSPGISPEKRIVRRNRGEAAVSRWEPPDLSGGGALQRSEKPCPYRCALALGTCSGVCAASDNHVPQNVCLAIPRGSGPHPRSSPLVPLTNVYFKDTNRQRSEGAEPAMPAPMIWNCLKDSRPEPRSGRNTMTIHQQSQNSNRKLIATTATRVPRNSNHINKRSPRLIEF